jgi:tetratricopeptide (TPR) repeat protein
MSKNFLSYPTEEISSSLRTVFIYAATEDVNKLPALAERIAHPHNGTKCRVKWLNPDMPVDETDLKNELTLSQVLIVYVTKSLIANIREMNHLPLPIGFMRDNHKPYFPIADVAENLEVYCKLDRPIHGLMESDSDFESKLKEQLSKYVLDEETLAEIKEKGIIDQIFLSYRKDDVIAAQNLMREIHNFKGFDAISIWYDRFLSAGNLFDKEILEALDQSKAFTIVMSPKITAKREDGSNNYVVEHEYPRAHEKKKPIVPIHVPNYACNHDELKSVFKDIPELLAIEQTEPYLRSIFPDLPSIDTYSSERLYLLGRAYLSGYYFEQDAKKGISLLEKAAGHKDEFALKSAKMLAELYESGNLDDGINYDEELKWYLRAAEIAEKIFGKEHQETYVIYINIGTVYSSKSYYEKALDYYDKSLRITEKIFGKDSIQTAANYSNIGHIYLRTGNYEKALEYHSMAIEIEEKVFNNDHPQIATSYNNIGMVYDKKGNYEKALNYHLKALEIREKVSGKFHPDTAVSYNNVGLAYHQKGDFDKALEHYFIAIEIREKVLSKDHPYTATTYNNIGLVYSAKYDCNKALEYNFKALEMREKVLGKDHHDTATSYNSIGTAYQNKFDFDKALIYFINALEIYEKVLGKEHPDTAACYNNIGIIYDNTGNSDKALEYYFKALETAEKLLGKGHPKTATTYYNIATAYNSNGNYEKALEYYKKTLLVFVRIFGMEHSNVKAVLRNAYRAFQSSGKTKLEYDNWFMQILLESLLTT